jgi:DNA-binding NarL/FixJ family response regulator
VSDLKEAVLEGFQAGKKKKDIAEELQISLSTVSNIRKLLIQEGRITAEEIKNLKKKQA